MVHQCRGTCIRFDSRRHADRPRARFVNRRPGSDADPGQQRGPVGSALFGRRAGALAAMGAAGCPFLTYYAQEARMYSLVAVLSFSPIRRV